MTQAISCLRLAQISDVIAAQMGLHFPKARWRDLERGLGAAAREFGFADVDTCMARLISSPLTQRQIATLADHLTVGETYFFREPQTFAVLATHILPSLMRARRNSTRRLSIWSAGCATGEEPYSIAMAISTVIPDVREWDITLLATDLNSHFLQRAAAGLYREWSFRATPAWIKERYFTRQSNGDLTILPTIQAMVQFAYLNLLDDVYPAPFTTTAMDLIFCRNVLMYFAPEQAKKVVHKLYDTLADGGWLIVSPHEISQALFASFQTVNLPGAMFYRKAAQRSPSRPNVLPREALPAADVAEVEGPLSAADGDLAESRGAVAPPASGQGATVKAPASLEPEPVLLREALASYQQGRYAEVVDKLSAYCADTHAQAPAVALLARAYANQGKLAEARQWCEKALAVDKLKASIHYLHASILQEQGAVDDAIRSLQRTLYLDQNFVLAHLALGTLARRQGKLRESGKHVENALAILSAYRQDEILPETEGITAGRLREVLASMPKQHTAG
jgi:chemotaxis protein methyltransferase CheR